VRSRSADYRLGAADHGGLQLPAKTRDGERRRLAGDRIFVSIVNIFLSLLNLFGGD